MSKTKYCALFTVIGAIIITTGLFYSNSRSYTVITACRAGGAYGVTVPPSSLRHIVSTGTERGLPFWISMSASSDSLNGCPPYYATIVNGSSVVSPIIPSDFRPAYLVLDLLIWGVLSFLVSLLLVKVRKQT